MTSSLSWFTSWLSRANRLAPTRKTAGIVAVIAFCCPVAGHFHVLTLWIVIASAVLLALAIRDALSLPAHSQVTAERTVPHLVERATGSVTIAIAVEPAARAHAHGWTEGLTIKVRDDTPVDTIVSLETLAAKGTDLPAQLEYAVTPRRRGDMAFGDIYIRITSPLGLMAHHYRIPARQSCPVWPDTVLTPAKQAALQPALQREGLRVRRTAGGMSEFAHIRDFAVGDDPRHINWFATARRNTVMRNVYQPERGQQVILAIDCGRSMGMLQTAGKTRLDLALEAALLTAAAALQNGDDVSVIAFSDTVHCHIPHVRGKNGMHTLLTALYHLQARPAFTGMHIMADLVYANHKRHALLLLFSDLTDLANNDLFERHIRVLEHRHTCVVASFTDEALEQVVHNPVETKADVVLFGVVAGLLNERRRFRERLRMRSITVIEARHEIFTAALAQYARYKF